MITLTATAKTKSGMNIPIVIEVDSSNVSAYVNGQKAESFYPEKITLNKKVLESIGIKLPTGFKTASIDVTGISRDQIEQAKRDAILDSRISIWFDENHYFLPYHITFDGESGCIHPSLFKDKKLGEFIYNRENSYHNTLISDLGKYVRDQGFRGDGEYVIGTWSEFESILSSIYTSKIDESEKSHKIKIDNKESILEKANLTGEPQLISTCIVDNFQPKNDSSFDIINTYVMPDGSTKTIKIPGH